MKTLKSYNCWENVLEIEGYTFFISFNFRAALSHMSKKSIKQLVDTLYPVAVSAFAVEKSAEFYKDVNDHVTECDALLVCCFGGSIVGFAMANDFEKVDTLFLHGIAIESKFQHGGIASRITDVLLQYMTKKRFAFTTQNPRMFCLLRKKMNKVFPSPEMPEVNQIEWLYGQTLLEKRIEKGECIFVPEVFTLNNLYTNCLYEKIPFSKDEKVNAWFEKMLCIKNDQTRNGFLLCGEQ